ncbi:hypothetical protein BGZ92_009029 [Podila epicladia]|nr:hypothetical protein BGZ92_009029 [Podila epicladia]
MKFSVLSLTLATTFVLSSSPSCYAQDTPAAGGELISVLRESKVPLTNSMNALQNNDLPALSSTSYTRKRRYLARLDSSSYDPFTTNMVPEPQGQPSFQHRRQLHLVNRRLRIRNSGPQRLVSEKRGLLDDLVGKVAPTTAAVPAPTNGNFQEGDEGELEPESTSSSLLHHFHYSLRLHRPLDVHRSYPSSASSPSAPSPPSFPPTSSEQPTAPSEQPPTITEEHPTTTLAPELITSQQPTQGPVETSPPANPSSSDDDTPSTRTHTSTPDENVPTAGTPGTSQSTVGPSTLPESKDESGGNKTSITIGVVIAAILIAAGIGVWVFRKWKLSPSRQFKSKIRSGSVSGGTAAAAVGSRHDDNPSEYNSYDNIFRPQPHESTVPMTMPGAAATTGVSMMGGMSANEYEHYDYEYPTQPPMAHPGYHHQAQMSMSSAAGSVTDYGQYRYPLSTSSIGYDPAVVAHSMAAHGGGSPNNGNHLHGYGSQDYSQNDQFLRELRE